MKNSLIAKITLSTLITSISTLAIAHSALGLTWNIAGTFEDGGKLGGSFDFDGTDYSQFNITTTGGSSGVNLIPSGTTYTDSDFLSGFGATGFTISKDDGSFDLIVEFISNISTVPEVISLNTTTTQETDYDNSGKTRALSSGTVAAVPFELSPTLGLLLVGGIWGLSYLKKKQFNQ